MQSTLVAQTVRQMQAACKQNWFNTLNEALESEGLLDSWEIWFSPIQYGETFCWTWEDGSRHGRQISIFRDEKGRYERPVHYRR